MDIVERGHIDDHEGELYIRYLEDYIYFEMNEFGGLYCRGHFSERLIVEDDGGLYLKPVENEHTRGR